jgi:hypothetical protein
MNVDQVPETAEWFSGFAATAAQAPSDTTLVVFRTAGLAYVPDPAQRLAFGDQVAALGARCVSQEGRDVLVGRSTPSKEVGMSR